MLDTLLLFQDRVAHSGPLNMAMDEALLSAGVGPLLRFYQWARPTVSFGYFGSHAEAVAFAGDRDLVRRWTGGGMVPHGRDCTYSLVLPRSELTINTRDLYRMIHQAIVSALALAGVKSSLARADAPKLSDACFANPMTADVMEAERKIAGAAQRKTRAGLLLQGSIQRQGLPVDFNATLARILSSEPVPFEPDARILAEAETLAATKYATEGWNRRR